MSFKTTLLGAGIAAFLTLPAIAGSEIRIEDGYARASGLRAMAGAAFMHILNTGDTDDQLIAVRTDAAKRAELHTHVETEGGVMQMRRVEGGFAIPAGGDHWLARGGDHIMLMGLTRPLAQGDSITLTLTFEQAGDITIDLPVDLER